jgi:hypothetical protein
MRGRACSRWSRAAANSPLSNRPAPNPASATISSTGEPVLSARVRSCGLTHSSLLTDKRGLGPHERSQIGKRWGLRIRFRRRDQAREIQPQDGEAEMRGYASPLASLRRTVLPPKMNDGASCRFGTLTQGRDEMRGVSICNELVGKPDRGWWQVRRAY